MNLYCQENKKQRAEIPRDAILGWCFELKKLAYVAEDMQCVIDEQNGEIKEFNDNNIKIIDFTWCHYKYLINKEKMKQEFSLGTAI